MLAAKRILVLAPHTDDGELGCGGTISKLCGQGREVYQIAFSSAPNIVKDGMENQSLVQEYRKAGSILGIKETAMISHEFPVRRFHDHRQDILDLMLHYKGRIKPDLVLLPSGSDVHQDHKVIHDEGVRAFKDVSILGYELPWNLMEFKNQIYVSLGEEDVKNKIEACKSYTSQHHRPYMATAYLEGLLITRGVQIKQQFAECFECIRIIQ